MVATVVLDGGDSYRSVHLADPGTATSTTSAILELVALIAGSLTLGGLVRAAFLDDRHGRDRMRLDGPHELAPVMWASLVWFVTAVALVGVDAADSAGVPLDAILQPGNLAHLVQGSYLPVAWIVVAVIALLLAIAAFIGSRWSTLVVGAAGAAVALLAPVLVTHVLVGPNHDFAGDASMFGTPAAGVLVGVLVLTAGRPDRIIPVRLRWTVLVLAVVAVAGDIVVLAVELAGRSPFSTPTGWLYLGKDLLLVLVALLVVLPAGRPWRIPPVRIATAAGLALLVAAATVAIGRIPPPVFFVPTSIAQNFLGYNVWGPPTPLNLAFDWRPSILFITISVLGVAVYLAAVVRLHRRGDRWPLGRTIAWILGWVVVVLTTSSGVGRYSGASFSVHMALHMSLNMLGPLLLVLGGVITLMLRATTAHPAREPAGPHEWLNALMKAPIFKLSYNPLYVLAIFVGSYFALYFTPIFDLAMRYHWSHQLMNIHFIVVGYFFYGLVIGVDTTPRELPHIGKLGLVLAAMPFHAFFGIAVMTSKDIIASTFFGYLHLPWMNLKADQYLGGGVAWSAGELPLLVIVIALVTQWARQDARLAKRTDRHLDAGLDTSFDAYNEMLTRFAQRDARQSEEPR